MHYPENEKCARFVAKAFLFIFNYSYFSQGNTQVSEHAADRMPHQSSQEVRKEPGQCKAPWGIESQIQMAVADLLSKFVTHPRCFLSAPFFLVLTHVSPPC